MSGSCVSFVCLDDDDLVTTENVVTTCMAMEQTDGVQLCPRVTTITYLFPQWFLVPEKAFSGTDAIAQFCTCVMEGELWSGDVYSLVNRGFYDRVNTRSMEQNFMCIAISTFIQTWSLALKLNFGANIVHNDLYPRNVLYRYRPDWRNQTWTVKTNGMTVSIPTMGIQTSITDFEMATTSNQEHKEISSKFWRHENMMDLEDYDADSSDHITQVQNIHPLSRDVLSLVTGFVGFTKDEWVSTWFSMAEQAIREAATHHALKTPSQHLQIMKNLLSPESLRKCNVSFPLETTNVDAVQVIIGVPTKSQQKRIRQLKNDIAKQLAVHNATHNTHSNGRT